MKNKIFITRDVAFEELKRWKWNLDNKEERSQSSGNVYDDGEDDEV